jgi:hypothetical protein
MRARNRHRLAWSLVLALVLGALAVPAAYAYIPDLETPAAATAGSDDRDYPSCVLGPCASEQADPAGTSQAGGFDWTDAGVGAGFAIGVVLLASGIAVLALRRRRPSVPAV